jgi:hypothetical protein
MTFLTDQRKIREIKVILHVHVMLRKFTMLSKFVVIDLIMHYKVHCKLKTF